MPAYQSHPLSRLLSHTSYAPIASLSPCGEGPHEVATQLRLHNKDFKHAKNLNLTLPLRGSCQWAVRKDAPALLTSPIRVCPFMRALTYDAAWRTAASSVTSKRSGVKFSSNSACNRFASASFKELPHAAGTRCAGPKVEILSSLSHLCIRSIML